MTQFALSCLLTAAVLMSPARADNPVLDWNEAARHAIGRATLPPGLAARQLAILHLAMWQASTQSDGSAAAVSAAANEVCVTLFAGDAAPFSPLSVKFQGPDPAMARQGRAIARTVIESRADDGSTTTIHYVPKDSPGQWRRTTRNRPPELPHWPHVTPFSIPSSSAFRLPPPPALDSAEYATAWQEVLDLGGRKSIHRTAEQSEIAVFWSDFSYTSSPPGHWNEIAHTIALQKDLPLGETARLFAVLNVALADAGIAAFDSKYYHNFWRPVTAIAEANRDGNAATRPDPDWAPCLATPSHPEYPSAHSVFSGAAATTLAKYFGTDEVTFEIGSDSVPHTKRTFTSFSSCAQEISCSRIYGGIHFTFSGDRGLALGKQVADLVWDSFSSGDPPLSPVRRFAPKPPESPVPSPRQCGACPAPGASP